MVNLSKIIPALQLTSEQAFEQHELLRKALGGQINQLIALTRDDLQTVKVAAAKIKELGYNIRITKPDFAKDINAILSDLPENIIIEFARALVSANIQRRPGEEKWQEANDMLRETVNGFNIHYVMPYKDWRYTPINLDIDANKAKKPVIGLGTKKKKIHHIPGERSANDTVDLVAPPAELVVNKITNSSASKGIVSKKDIIPPILMAPTNEATKLLTECASIMVEGKSNTSQPRNDIVTVANQSTTLKEFFESMIFKSYRKHMSKKIVLKVEKYLLLAGYTYDELYSIFKIDEFNIPKPTEEIPVSLIDEADSNPVLEKELDEIQTVIEVNKSEIEGSDCNSTSGIPKLEPISEEVQNSFKLPTLPVHESFISKIINGIKKLFSKGK